MIRHANKHDKTEIIAMMKEFRAQADFPELCGEDNEPHWNGLLDNIFAGQGVIFYEQNKGLLMAVVLPTIWDNNIKAMHELAWYVRPNERNTTVGYRLFVSYIEYAKKIKSEGRINYFTITKLDTSPDLNYARFGFRKKDENWIQ